MIAAAPVMDMPAFVSRTKKGESDAASVISREVEKYLRHSTKPRLEILAPQIISLVLDHEQVLTADMAPVSLQTAYRAMQFAMLLPHSAPIPEVAADPDGEIAFDWIKVGKTFSVSIGPSGKISYAGRFSDKSKIHGTEQLSEALPVEVLLGIERASK